MTQHSQRPAQVRAARLLAMAGAVPLAQLAAPATPGVSKSVPGDSQFRSNGTSKTGRDTATITVRGKILPPGAATKPTPLGKSP